MKKRRYEGNNMKKMVTSLVIAAGLLISSPLNSEAALGDRTLKSGTTHSDVKELQQVLKNGGYFKGNTTTYFGSSTQKAVVNFQKAKGLKADGIVGAGTYKALGVKNTSAKGNVSAKRVQEAKKYLSVPYVWGGTTPKGFDCSGFIGYVFKKSSNTAIPRTVSDIYKKGQKVSSPQVGDLVFFQTYQSGASHAGIYIGNNKFIHSSSSQGVSVSSIGNSYWKKRYLGAKRI